MAHTHLDGTSRNPAVPVISLLIVATLILLLALFSPTNSAQASEPGINDNNQLYSPSQLGAKTINSGKWVREFVNWQDVEPSSGTYNQYLLGAYVQAAKAAKAHGLQTVLDVVGTPFWVSGASDVHAPPDPAQYAQFIHTFASTPGIQGNVSAYEIWNEEDAPIWWRGAPDPAAYTRLLQAAYPAIKSADPNATVLVGGLTGNDWSYVQELYANGAKGYFDGIAVHDDTACLTKPPSFSLRDLSPTGQGRLSQWTFSSYREIHEIMVSNGDGAKTIWMTELGWSTDTSICKMGAVAGTRPAGVSEATQATYLTQAYQCLAADPYVAVAIWFDLQDTPGGQNHSLGLYRGNGTPKPSADTFASASGATPDPSCGQQVEASSPTISVSTPIQGERITSSSNLPIGFTATDAQEVFRVHLSYDGGKSIRNWGYGVKPSKTLRGSMDWFGARFLSLGKHVLTITVLNSALKETTAQIVIYKVAPTQRTSTRLSIRGAVLTARVSLARGGSANGKLTIHVDKTGQPTRKFSRSSSKTFRLKLSSGTYKSWAIYSGGHGNARSRSKVLRFHI